VIREQFGEAFPDVVPGTPFAGIYTFNPQTLDDNSLDGVGDYWHYNSPYGVIVFVGSHWFETNPDNVAFLSEISNNFSNSDNYLFRSYNNLDVDGTPINYIAWQLDDNSMQALQDPSITSAPIDLSKWQSIFGFTVEMPGGMLRGDVADVHVLGPGEPIGLPDPNGIPGPPGPPGPQGPAGPLGEANELTAIFAASTITSRQTAGVDSPR